MTESPLRVAVVFDGERPARWVLEAITRVRQIEGWQVCLLAARLVRATRAHYAAHWLPYLWIDRALSANVDDEALGELVSESIADSVVMHDDELGAVLAEAGPDALLCLDSDYEPVNLPFTLGAWRVVADPQAPMRAVAAQRTVITASVESITSQRRLRESHSRVDQLSVAITRQRHLKKLSSLPALALADLVDGEPGTESEMDPCAQARLLPFLGAAGRRLMRTAVRHLARKQWFIAYQLNPEQPVPELAQMTVLPSPRDRFWADPFPVEWQDRRCIFVEEWPYARGRGHIAVLEVDDDSGVGHLGTALELPYHLSHPQVLECDDELYMIPESGARGTVELFHCVEFPLRWEPVATLLDNVRAVDATLHREEEGWWMFVNIGDGAISTYEELHLFWSESLRGPWTPHPRNPVVSDPRRARPAGRLFQMGDALYRPAQDCGERYGGAIVIHEVAELTKNSYRESPHTRLQPQSLQGANRIHTLNSADWITVVDAHRDQWLTAR
ncbi:MAG: hypothetical protein VX733_08120 [Candidatus Latescibacterota bacterium]|nr:hypothetical protein [Candidatus Latescibacterota bacterium]